MTTVPKFLSAQQGPADAPTCRDGSKAIGSQSGQSGWLFRIGGLGIGAFTKGLTIQV